HGRQRRSPSQEQSATCAREFVRFDMTVGVLRRHDARMFQSSLIVGGPLPAVFSYLPLPTLRYCVKPRLDTLLSRSTWACPATTLGAPITRASGALHAGHAA